MKILIANEQALVRELISKFLEGQLGANLEQANDVGDTLNKVKALGPFDLVLLDHSMPGMNWLDGLRTLIELNQGQPVAILSRTASRSIAEAALEFGAAGFVTTAMSLKNMVFAVKFMIEGEKFAPLEFLFNDKPENLFGLSGREREVLIGICSGKSNKEIARDLELQEVTVKMHVRSLTSKMEAKNRTHAAMIARDSLIV